MFKKLSFVLSVVLLLASSTRAEDSPAPAKESSVMTFFRHLKSSLSQSAVQGERKKTRGGSVAAVRGKGQYSRLSNPDETSLKGDARSKKDKQVLAEDAEFEKAVDLVLAGKTDEGVKAMEDFKTKHPKSSHVKRVQEALDQLKGASETAAPAKN